MNLAPGMAPTDGGGLTRSQAAINTALMDECLNKTEAMYNVPINNSEAQRCMPKDLLWAQRSNKGLRATSTNYEMTAAGIPAHAVLNGYGKPGQTKWHYYQENQYIGPCTGTMQPHPENTGAKPDSAIDKQGITYIRHNNPYIDISAGDILVAAVPEDTKDALDRAKRCKNPREGIPDNRIVSFPEIWDPKKISEGMLFDWSKLMRGDFADGEPTMYPSTEFMVEILRHFITMGAVIGIAAAEEGDPGSGRLLFTQEELLDHVSDQARDDNSLTAKVVNLIDNAQFDPYIATLITPKPEEHFVTTPRIPPGTPRTLRRLYAIQKSAAPNMFRGIDNCLQVAGRDRIIGKALNNPKFMDYIQIIAWH